MGSYRTFFISRSYRHYEDAGWRLGIMRVMESETGVRLVMTERALPLAWILECLRPPLPPCGEGPGRFDQGDGCELRTATICTCASSRPCQVFLLTV
jgi:hypothetical protein